jgi:uncharacterized protein (TIGR03437 family)
MKYAILTTVLCSLLPAAAIAQNEPAETPSLRETAEPYLRSSRAAGNAFVNVSSASGMPNLAPDSLATALGSNLAATTESGTAPYPPTLGGITLQVVDSTGNMRLAPLLMVSSSRIDYLIPAGTAPGLATMNIVDATGNMLNSTAPILPVAPGLFTANGDGHGVVAATAYRLVDLIIRGPVTVYQCGDTPGSCVGVPIDVGLDAPVYVTLRATGLRGRSSDGALTVTIAGQAVPVQSISSADDSGPDAGIDEVLIGLPLSLRGSGEVRVVISVDGTSSNHGTINIK